jgi:hypothetical protein
LSRLIIKIIIIIKDDFLYLSRRRRLEELDSGGGRICGRTDGRGEQRLHAGRGRKGVEQRKRAQRRSRGEMNDEALHYAMIGGRPKGEATSDRVAAATAAGSGSSSIA